VSKTTKYPVEWKGKTLYLSDLTADVKETFCQWLRPRYVFAAYQQTKAPGLTDEMRKHAAAEHQAAQALVNSGGVYWNAEMSMAVAVAVPRDDGFLFLNRLLLGESAKVREPDGNTRDWTDDELRAFLREKDPERPANNAPVTDYQSAMDAIWEAELPKATGGTTRAPVPSAPSGPPPSAGPAGTGGSSPSSPPGTSASPPISSAA
jgi:hypothetical protein